MSHPTCWSYEESLVFVWAKRSSSNITVRREDVDTFTFYWPLFQSISGFHKKQHRLLPLKRPAASSALHLYLIKRGVGSVNLRQTIQPKSKFPPSSRGILGLLIIHPNSWVWDGSLTKPYPCPTLGQMWGKHLRQVTSLSQGQHTLRKIMFANECSS